ncbi:MAG TPA: hypothetical protein VIH88_11900 [Candidatus Acidoferrales bacterium]
MIRRTFLVAALLLFFVPSGLHACTCSKLPPGKCPGLQSDDVVFLGTVTDVAAVAADVTTAESATAAANTNEANPGAAPQTIAPITRYHFHIDEKFAGPDTADIDVFSGGDDADCGYYFKKGEQYIVFTQQETEGRLFAVVCSNTRPVSEGRALLPQLRSMRNHDRVASVFGVLRRADPPLLAPTDDPEDPIPHIKLKLRSKDDRFSTSTGPDGVYSFYDVHAGEYVYTADLPARFEFSQKTLKGGLPPFRIPAGACYEYNVNALPTGKIRGSVLGPNGKSLKITSVELYRAGRFDPAQPGLWGFQGSDGKFEFDHIGPGEYLLVFNRMNRVDPNSPFPRTFYPGEPDEAEAKIIKVKDGQQILNANIKLKDGYPTRTVKVQLKWTDGRPPGELTVTAHAEKGENPAARKIGEGLYEFTLLQSTIYTFSAWEDLDPQRLSQRHGNTACTIPARINSNLQKIDSDANNAATVTRNNAGDTAGGDAAANATDSAASDATNDPSTITLTFTSPPCNK